MKKLIFILLLAVASFGGLKECEEATSAVLYHGDRMNYYAYIGNKERACGEAAMCGIWLVIAKHECKNYPSLHKALAELEESLKPIEKFCGFGQ